LCVDKFWAFYCASITSLFLNKAEMSCHDMCFDLAEGSCQMVKNLNDSNESIKSDPVQIVVKNYLRFHQSEVRSVWSNSVSVTGHRRQVDSLSANLKQTALTLSFSPWSVLLMTVESMPKGTPRIRQSGLEIVWQLLYAFNCKRNSDRPLTFFIKICMIDSLVSWYSYH